MLLWGDSPDSSALSRFRFVSFVTPCYYLSLTFFPGGREPGNGIAPAFRLG